MRIKFLLFVVPIFLLSGCGFFKTYNFDAQVETAVLQNHEQTVANYERLKEEHPEFDKDEYTLMLMMENAYLESMKNIFTAQKKADSEKTD